MEIKTQQPLPLENSAVESPARPSAPPQERTELKAEDRRLRKQPALGEKFGRLTVKEAAPDYFKPDGRKSRRWSCLCDCGNMMIAHEGSLKGAHTQSCGCLQSDRAATANLKHGLTARGEKPPPTYHSWAAMVQRCTNPKNHKYPRYGGRGITICERWLVFENFLKDMGFSPPGTTIDRENNDLGYFKDNCRWATPVQQANNTSTNHFITRNGERHTLANWERKLGLNPETIKSRLRKGWTEEEALST